MIPLDIDSTSIQNIVQNVAGIGLNLLPNNFQILAPAISSLITILTAAIIRYFEKKKIHQEQKETMRELMHLYLQKDSAELSKRIYEMQKKDL